MREHFLARCGDKVEVVGDHGKLRGYQNSRGLFSCAPVYVASLPRNSRKAYATQVMHLRHMV